VSLLEEGKAVCCLTMRVDNIVCYLQSPLLNKDNTVDSLVFFNMTLTLKHVQTVSHTMSKIPPSVKQTLDIFMAFRIFHSHFAIPP